MQLHFHANVFNIVVFMQLHFQAKYCFLFSSFYAVTFHANILFLIKQVLCNYIFMQIYCF